ncbi:GyrI-like domain-containing protein [Lentzea sp. NEAU-D7]|uniref:GyrI-like domain-containing protein n=1 Tax=Lentzea sp. NEAU-D7 TaxID=2994667 RepID=UPI00224A4F7C|nr:GyrI-like domain-containing protein [Lentzea sp. NEAU-D7]MCX2953064.1 GyrI-like domain-containing protein [Lentzea sp. NEAU-D7]
MNFTLIGALPVRTPIFLSVGVAGMDIETRAKQPCAAVRGTVTPKSSGKIADRFPEVMRWLADRKLLATGAPFLRCSRVSADEFEVEAGIPTVAEVPGGGEVFTAGLAAVTEQVDDGGRDPPRGLSGAYIPIELYCWHGIYIRRAGGSESPGDPRPAA